MQLLMAVKESQTKIIGQKVGLSAVVFFIVGGRPHTGAFQHAKRAAEEALSRP
jgi:hypothetical protein